MSFALAKIRGEECIGCAKCIAVCPVDAIIGSHNQLHFVLNQECIGCRLCVPACPVDCIEMLEDAEKLFDPKKAQLRHRARIQRLETEKIMNGCIIKLKPNKQKIILNKYYYASEKKMTPKKIKEIFSRFEKARPEPTTELIYASPFELLISVILSAQATDVSVNRATEKLFKVANTPAAIFKLGEENLKKYIKTIGLYNSKASNILKTCAILINQHQSEIPNTREALESLPGVGRKTANVILNTAFKQKTMAVDTHIFRVANRIGIAPGKNVLEVEKNLLKNIPERFLQHAHHWLILHGRYVCVARKPKCAICPIHDLCDNPDVF